MTLNKEELLNFILIRIRKVHISFKHIVIFNLQNKFFYKKIL